MCLLQYNSYHLQGNNILMKITKPKYLRVETDLMSVNKSYQAYNTKLNL